MTIVADPDGVLAQHAVYLYVNVTAPVEAALNRAADRLDDLTLPDRPIETGMVLALDLVSRARPVVTEQLALRRSGARGDFALIVTGPQQRRVAMPLALTGANTVDEAVAEIFVQLVAGRALLGLA